MRTSLFAAAWLLLAASACSDDAGTGGGGTGGTGATGGTASTGSGGDPSTGGSGAAGGEGGTPQTCEGRCVDLPAGFDGLIVLGAGTEPECNDPAFIGGDSEAGFTAADATCGCACDVLIANCDAEGTAYDGAGCTGGTVTFDASPTTCREPPDTGADWLSVTISISGSGICMTDDADPILSPIEFDDPLWGCPPDVDGTCSSGACAPASGPLCFFSFDESECPADLVLSRSIYRFDNLIDKRDCECTCGAGTVDCNPNPTLSTDSMCIGDLDTSTSFGCTEADNGSPFTALALDGTFTADCSDVTYTPFGEIEVAGHPLIVCCEP